MSENRCRDSQRLKKMKKMKASKRKVAKEDLKTNLVGDRERAEGGDPRTETLVQNNVTHASRILRSKAGGTQTTSRRGRGRGRGMGHVNLGDSRSTPTGEGTSEDSGADVGASVEGILQILVRCPRKVHGMSTRFSKFIEVHGMSS
jgi:hypothetical protein